LERAREALIDAVGWSLVPMYCLAEPIAVFVLLGLLVWSIIKVMEIVWACMIYHAQGMGLWLLGALWTDYHENHSAGVDLSPIVPLEI
jgi:hypothetical protein